MRFSLIVVDTKGLNLIVRDALRSLRINWVRLLEVNVIEIITAEEKLENILSDYKKVFKFDPRSLTRVEIELDVDPNCKPRFCKVRPVPCALRVRVKEELEQLIASDILDPVQFSIRSAPILLVLKDDDSVRIYLDYK